MAVFLVKNQKESVDRLISRFNKKVQGSRILVEVRRRRYRKKPLTKRIIRQAAVMREFYRARKDKMKYY